MTDDPTPPTDSNYKGLYMQIGLNVKRARKACNLTQEELGEKVHLSRTSVTNIEKGRQKILIHTLANLAAALETPLSELVPPQGANNGLEERNRLSHLPESSKDFVKSFFQTTPKTKTNAKRNNKL